MQYGPKPIMSARQPRPAASFAAGSKRWTSSAARPGSQNAQRNYERYLALAAPKPKSATRSGQRTTISTPSTILGRCPRTEKEGKRLRCDGRLWSA